MKSPLKKIPATRATLGMYVRRIEGKWLDHPFWRGSFRVADAETLKLLRALREHEIWIDTHKGTDEAPPAPPPALPDDSPPAPPCEPAAPRTAFGDDVVRAEAIRDRAKLAARALFEDARLGRALRTENLAGVVDELDQAIARNPSAMLSVVRLKNKDDYTYLHSVAVAALMMALGRRLGFEGAALTELGVAGLLHDIGKVGVPDATLNKPGRLEPLELASVRQHPELGWDILRRESAAGPVALEVCLHHHEKTDGSGYPHRLGGEAISRVARMGAICDVYDAITSDRPYKRGWEPAEAIRRMAEWQEGHFDRQIFHAFVRLIGIYPAGTLVRLASDRIAMVLEQSAGSSLTPTVRLVCSAPDGEPLEPAVVELEHGEDRIVAIEEPGRWGVETAQLLRA
ncbi:MAG TPA: HD-GYP domain-containing protein [Frateuria sp.]|uniref:HD-GYP domain-containing protein n=1 Tax=Frateuria sp. TaxID=2211372 RepID=UPI002D8021E0|nr:HD-GYP domain-containing protein [Frateuria sp.]HET6807128.1 HD-GYP domain-containing protein [Frateuria sp.]